MNVKSPAPKKSAPVLSLDHLLDPEVLADPYPLYHRLCRRTVKISEAELPG